jgi:hypothetical protein
MKTVERWARLGLAWVICAAALAAGAPACVSQNSIHKTKKAPPPPPMTSAELFAYLHGALMEYSADDGVNDNLEVTIDPTATILTIKQPDGHCDIFLDSLDPNTISWDVYDASDSMQTRAPLARMTVVALAGKKARTCYDPENNIDPSTPVTRARILFSWDKIPEGSGLQSKFTKAFKRLVLMSEGAEEKTAFK